MTNTIFGHPIYTPRRFHIFMRRTTTPHSSLLTRERETFKSNQKAPRPTGYPRT